MKAAVFNGAGKPLSVEIIDDPKPEHHEVVIEVKRCGICGTDLHLTQEHEVLPPGTVLGHEFIGEIVEIGQGVDDNWKMGNRLTAMPFISCGVCLNCQLGRPFQCEKLQILGWILPGGFSQYMRVDVNNAIHVPESIGWDEGALIEPLAVGLHCARAAINLEGKNVLVIGAGPIGLTTAFWARFMGARHVIVSELDEGRLSLAEKFCATELINGSKEEVGPSFEKYAGGPPDVIFECVGVPGMIEKCIEHAGYGTELVIVGYCMKQDSFVPASAMAKELTVRFATAYNKSDYQFVTDMMAGNRVDAMVLHTGNVGFDEFSNTFENLRQPGQECKILLDPGL